MAHFAKVEDSIITSVIVAEQEYIDTIGGTWVQTSHNNNFRKQYAGIGDTYDVAKDIFIRKQPYPSHTLNENDDWQPLLAYPDPDTSVNGHFWNEDTTSWVEANPASTDMTPYEETI